MTRSMPVPAATFVPASRLQEKREPWTRQPGETPKAFAAFCVYRDLGMGRSLVEARKRCGGSVEHWSTKYGWVRRAAAWDNHLEAEAQRTIEEKHARARARHHGELLEIRHEVVYVSREILRKVHAALDDEQEGKRKISPRELADLARSVAEIARTVNAGATAEEAGEAAQAGKVIDLSQLPAGSMVEAMRVLVGTPEPPEPPSPQPAQLVGARVLPPAEAPEPDPDPLSTTGGETNAAADQ